ncbi:hypothetical protein [Litoreibacter arenae]|uniref:Uncharacterized protein n=1 Tax=Litoreibacter arenae DSM 19593 TaxID=1123360 RepID=S9S1U6_9RHOB|nr:hypothetical protein [Litoreibacter arenae]EPX80179.1 hypothetical protein thalar_01518 [Litoreibacter arenae DSM 19593]
MNTFSLEDTLNELERQAAASTVTDKELVKSRLRRLASILETRSTVRASIVPDDDLLFDNVPV